MIQEGLSQVKKILSENYVRPDEAEKIKSKIKELGQYKIIDKLTVKLNEKKDLYEATLLNLGVKGVEVSSSYIKKYEKLLVGGIWCIVSMNYFYEERIRNNHPSAYRKSNLSRYLTWIWKGCWMHAVDSQSRSGWMLW